MNNMVSKELGAIRRKLAREAFAKIVNQEFEAYLLEESREVGPDDVRVKMERGLSHGYGYQCSWRGKETEISGTFRKESDDEQGCVWVTMLRDWHIIKYPFTPFPLDEVLEASA